MGVVLPVVLALLAVVLQVGNVVVVAVGVVAAALAADQTFDFCGLPCSFLTLSVTLLLSGWRSRLCPPGPGPAAGLYSMDQQHLTDTVGAEVLQQLGAISGLKATGPALERLGPLLLLLLLWGLGAGLAAGLAASLGLGLAAGLADGLGASLGAGFAAALGLCRILDLPRWLLIDVGLRGLWVMWDAEVLLDFLVRAIPVNDDTGVKGQSLQVPTHNLIITISDSEHPPDAAIFLTLPVVSSYGLQLHHLLVTASVSRRCHAC